VDLTNRVAMAEAAAQVTERLGSIELLMTAAEAYEAAPIGEIEADRWQRLLDVWLGGTVNACAAVLPNMLKAGCGTIVTLSVDLTQNSESEAYYAAATGTITGFTKSLALEVAAAGVRVNCIAPRRPVSLEGVAETVVFLATEGDFYVGQILFLCPKGGVL